ncbi:4Fe-4S double cluster binding domain-containing protein [Parasporobacterium paucivorans]|uniref:4Fe-4S double cluster binding domain-containing protein n=1 Tax=Parasporobacterium paucivorans TaxID=115544 RepID=UPI0015BD4C63|nr:4Fe-4S double cluster binding domain-containing protein [Parasporobacterium paucivorans]
MEKNEEMQNRRDLTFLIQEAAFAEKIPFFHILDCDLLADGKKARSIIFLGIPLYEPLLLMEQSIYGTDGESKCTMAQKKVESYLRNFSDKLEILGYNTVIKLPDILPDDEANRLFEMTKTGFVGKNHRFIVEDYGCRNYIGYILSDAPLMGGDYRYPEYDENLCGGCTLCLDQCPGGALKENGFTKERCENYRENSKNQVEIAAKSIRKCDVCYACCPIGTKTRWQSADSSV